MRALQQSIAEAWLFFRKEGIWGTMRSKEAPWLVQFGKYGICGVMATILHNVLFAVFALYLFPAVDTAMPAAERAAHFVYDNLIAFGIANTFVYFVNLAFVFEGGRHSRVREFSYFTGVNFLAMIPGLLLGVWAIFSGRTTPYAQLIFIVTAVLVNFLARKFFVFKK